MFHLRCQRPYGFSAPLLSLDQRSGLQGFYTVGFVDPVRDLRSTHGLSPSLAPQAIEPPNRPPQTKPRWCLSSFLEVSCPSAFPHTRQRPFCLSLPHSSACAFELSQPLDAFRHLASANHCFRLDPLLGFSPSELYSFRIAPGLVSKWVPLVLLATKFLGCSLPEGRSNPLL